MEILCYRLRMDMQILLDGLIRYVYLIILLTFHEFAHAWAALKCGDTTAQSQGRVSLNPIVHIDPIGTVVLPLIFTVLAATGNGGGFFFGWAKPVPFNLYNLNNPNRDRILIALAGPAMNLLLAALILPFAHINNPVVQEVAIQMTLLSLVLCFFNLLPIPPLDGSHVMKYLTGMTEETYYRIAQFGLIIILVALQIPLVRSILSFAIDGTFLFLARLFRLT